MKEAQSKREPMRRQCWHKNQVTKDLEENNMYFQHVFQHQGWRHPAKETGTASWQTLLWLLVQKITGWCSRSFKVTYCYILGKFRKARKKKKRCKTLRKKFHYLFPNHCRLNLKRKKKKNQRGNLVPVSVRRDNTCGGKHLMCTTYIQIAPKIGSSAPQAPTYKTMGEKKVTRELSIWIKYIEGPSAPPTPNC